MPIDVMYLLVTIFAGVLTVCIILWRLIQVFRTGRLPNTSKNYGDGGGGADDGGSAGDGGGD